MGGFFSSPKPAAPPPLPPLPVVAPVDTTAEQEAKRRAEIVARNRRGLLGTIATGARGALDPLGTWPSRKTLLGE